MELYEFDRKLRILIMDAIERIEVSLRTAVTYHLARAYGPFAHCDQKNFHPEFKHGDWIDRLNDEAEKSRETFIEHYKEKYDGFPRLPIWMASEVMTFGSLSRLYEGMLIPDKDRVCAHWKIPRSVMLSWLRTLTFIRNTCAHHARLWNRELACAPTMPLAKHGWPLKETPVQKRIFCVLIILRHLLDGQHAANPWQPEVTNLIDQIAVNKFFRDSMGLPENWKAHPRWAIV